MTRSYPFLILKFSPEKHTNEQIFIPQVSSNKPLTFGIFTFYTLAQADIRFLVMKFLAEKQRHKLTNFYPPSSSNQPLTLDTFTVYSR